MLASEQYFGGRANSQGVVVCLQTNLDQSWKLARDLLVGEASFTSSQEAHFLLLMRMSALGR